MNDEGHISLPALQSDLSQQPQVQIHGGRSAARRALAAGREGLNIVNRYRILIVDDDAMAREILKRILEHAGYEVMTAGSGPEALRKLHEGIPHLVVVDLMMPEMDGFELCRRIKSHLDVPIVILSAVAAIESKVEGLQMYAEDYIVKPFEKEELVARVPRVLRRGVRRRGAARSRHRPGAPDQLRAALGARQGSAGDPDADRVQAALPP